MRFVLALILAACASSPPVVVPLDTYDPAYERDGLAAAQAWLARIDRGDYAQGWDESASDLKTTVTKEAFARSLGELRGHLGALRSRTLKGAQYTTAVPGGAAGRYVVVVYEASFEDAESAVETVTPVLDADGHWRVAGYFVR